MDQERVDTMVKSAGFAARRYYRWFRSLGLLSPETNSVEDLQQEGMLYLLKIPDWVFDPSRANFSTFCNCVLQSRFLTIMRRLTRRRNQEREYANKLAHEYHDKRNYKDVTSNRVYRDVSVLFVTDLSPKARQFLLFALENDSIGQPATPISGGSRSRYGGSLAAEEMALNKKEVVAIKDEIRRAIAV